MAKPVSAKAGLALRLLAARRLQDVLRGAHFEPLTAADLPDGRDRALANRLLNLALRRHGHLDQAIATLLERGLPRKSSSFEPVLRLSLAQLLFAPDLGAHSALFLGVEALKRDPSARHLAGLLNAVLRRAQQDAPRWTSLSADTLFPPDLAARWREAYGPEALDAFATGLLDGAPLDLTLRDNNAALFADLAATALVGDSVRVSVREHTVSELPGFAAGRWWVQDVAASLPARLIRLPAGARVLDLCAAPGGKTAQLVKAGYHVTALDNDATRMQRLAGNLQRLGFAADEVVADAETYTPNTPFDAVLLDAPCSATGTLRRHPEVVWHRNPADAAARARLQQRLLAHAAGLLRPGGTLVYSVCSLEPEEGEAQADFVAASLPQLVPDPIDPDELAPLAGVVDARGNLRTHPGILLPAAGGMDGFFAMRLLKR